MAFGAGTAAGAAASTARQKLYLEEELMTPYTSDDLGQDWEFKIVRANTRAFHNPATFRKLVEEEARAGWIMLEKFDDSRVRFKRRAGSRINDANLPPGVDPYRTHYGISPGVYVILVVLTSLAFAFAMMVIVFFIVFNIVPRR